MAAATLSMSQPASAATASAGGAKAAAPCGFYVQGNEAYYNHCGSGRIKIRVRWVFWWNTADRCVGPGITGLEEKRADKFISNAWYIGSC